MSPNADPPAAPASPQPFDLVTLSRLGSTSPSLLLYGARLEQFNLRGDWHQPLEAINQGDVLEGLGRRWRCPVDLDAASLRVQRFPLVLGPE